MVAAGSQGNYPLSARLRIADWSSCTKLGRSVGDVVSAAVSLRETVDVGIEIEPAEVFLADPSLPPMAFGGHWGENSKMTLAGVTLLGGTGAAGPPSPPHQDIWRHPLREIFHEPTWHRATP
jgi:hypothetical protein